MQGIQTFFAAALSVAGIVALSDKLDMMPRNTVAILYGASFLRMPTESEDHPRWSDIAWDHTKLYDGQAKAKQDIVNGGARFYLYGLMSVDSTDQAAALLTPFRIEAKWGGCVTGTPKYHQDMLYNDYIQSMTSFNIPNFLKSNIVLRDRRSGSHGSSR